jgi:hypothetical protein
MQKAAIAFNAFNDIFAKTDSTLDPVFIGGPSLAISHVFCRSSAVDTEACFELINNTAR